MNDGIVVTGLGCLSALGVGVDETMANLYSGKVQAPMPGKPAISISPPPPLFRLPQPLPETDQPLLNRTSRLAFAALDEALAFSWNGRLGVPPERIGVCMGTTVGCTLNDEPFYREFLAGNDPDKTPIERFLSNDLSRVAAQRLGSSGPAVTVVNACSSGADAIGLAVEWLQQGLCDVAVAGGSDELSRYPYLGFIALKNSSRERCRPFDLHRQGLNLGEGAAVMILEREGDARRRGASILACLAAYASASDAYHPTAPHPDGRGLRKAIAAALAAARLAPGDIGFVNAHGTGTLENDRVEGRVLAQLLPETDHIFSTKGYTGHTTGAAGALEAVMTVMNLADQRVPRSAGFETPDPACSIVPTTETAEIKTNAALSSSLAFGGTNSVLLFAREGQP
jgi:3-oxoacyl-[acyl-carrier-protein] synthase II